MLLSGKFMEEGQSVRRKAHKGDKKKQSLANRGSILFSLPTPNLKEGRKGEKKVPAMSSSEQIQSISRRPKACSN